MPKRAQSSTRKPSAKTAFPGRQVHKAKTKKAIHLPYAKKIRQLGQVGIWQAAGSFVRTHIDEEFTNYGQHYAYPYIPEDEFWLDQGISPEEKSSSSSTCASNIA